MDTIKSFICFILKHKFIWVDIDSIEDTYLISKVCERCHKHKDTKISISDAAWENETDEIIRRAKGE